MGSVLFHSKVESPFFGVIRNETNHNVTLDGLARINPNIYSVTSLTEDRQVAAGFINKFMVMYTLELRTVAVETSQKI